MDFRVPGIYEILDAVENAKTRSDQILILRNQKSEALQMVLQGAFDSRIEWLLPEGDTPYNPADPIGLETTLYKNFRQMTYFAKGSIINLDNKKREMMFVQFLESIHPRDAAIINQIKDKKLPYKNITVDLIQEVWPELGIVPIKQNAITNFPEGWSAGLPRAKEEGTKQLNEVTTTKVKKKPGRKTDAERAARAKAQEQAINRLSVQESKPAEEGNKVWWPESEAQEYNYDQDPDILAQGLIPEIKEA